MTTKRNGLSARVARGMKRLRARACSSPWLITPRAAPSWPSTVTFSSTLRGLPVPVRWMSSRETLLWRRSWSQIGLGLLVDGGEALVADVVGRVLQPLLGGLEVRDGFGALLRLAGLREPVGQGRGEGAPGVFAGLELGVAAAAGVGRVDDGWRRLPTVPCEGLGRRRGRSVAVEGGAPGSSAIVAAYASRPTFAALLRGAPGRRRRELPAPLPDRASSAARGFGRFAACLQAARPPWPCASCQWRRARFACRRRGSRRRRGPWWKRRAWSRRLGQVLRLRRHGLGGVRSGAARRRAGLDGRLRWPPASGTGGRQQALQDLVSALSCSRPWACPARTASTRVEAPVLLPERRQSARARSSVERLELGRGSPCAPGRRPSALSRVRAGFWSGRLRVHELVEAEDRRERVVELRRALVEHRAELVVGEEGPVGGERRPPSRAPPCPCAACRGSARRWSAASRSASSAHSRATVQAPFSPSSANSASIAAFGWWRLRQPSLQTLLRFSQR